MQQYEMNSNKSLPLSGTRKAEKSLETCSFYPSPSYHRVSGAQREGHGSRSHGIVFSRTRTRGGWGSSQADVSWEGEGAVGETQVWTSIFSILAREEMRSGVMREGQAGDTITLNAWEALGSLVSERRRWQRGDWRPRSGGPDRRKLAAQNVGDLEVWRGGGGEMAVKVRRQNLLLRNKETNCLLSKLGQK